MISLEKLSPDLKVLEVELTKHVGNCAIILFGKCSSIFDGRIKSDLGLGDRILVVKKDLAIVLHDPEGVKPVQWQKSRVGSVKFTINNESQLQMQSFRPKTEEWFSITFQEIHGAFIYRSSETSEEIRLGDEKDFQAYLSKNIETIEPGLVVVSREKESVAGFIDIFTRDQKNNYVIIEVKKQAATLSDAHQLQRYRDTLKKEGYSTIRGILVATAISNRVQELLKKNALEWKEIPWKEIFPTRQTKKQPDKLKKWF